MKLFKNYVIPVLFALYLAACSTPQNFLSTSSAPNINQLMTDEDGDLHLIGVTTKEGFHQAPFHSWFADNFTSYQPKETILNTIKQKAKEVEVLAFMGTWCGDSRREVPKFYKVMQTIGVPEERIKMVNVYLEIDKYKKSPTSEEKGLNIHRVPTFIFYKEGKEIGRIVESPRTDMSTDIAQILNGTPTTPRYEVVSRIHKLLEEGKHDYIKEEQESLAEYAADHSSNSYELNTYGVVLYSQGKIPEAITVLTLNTLAYPKDAYTYYSLGRVYFRDGQKDLAAQNYQKALELAPDDEYALKALKELQETD